MRQNSLNGYLTVLVSSAITLTLSTTAALAAADVGGVVNGPANANFNFTIAEQPDMLFNPEIFNFTFALPAGASFQSGTLVLCEPGNTCSPKDDQYSNWMTDNVNWSDEILWNNTNGVKLISDGSPFVDPNINPPVPVGVLDEIGPEGSNGKIYIALNGNGGTATWMILSDVPEPGTLALLVTSILGLAFMAFSKTIARHTVGFVARFARQSFLTASFRWLYLVLIWFLVPGIASADQMTGTISIMDLTEAPITGRVVGGTLQVNQDITADKASPETLSFSIDVDGTVPGGMGMAVLLENESTASDLLVLTVTPKTRGMNIPFFTASGTFTSDTSDSDSGGLDAAALGITDKVISKAVELKLFEDGTQQNIGAGLVDPATGNALNIGGLSITAASDLGEPVGVLLLAPGLLVFGMVLWLRHKLTGEVANLSDYSA